MVRFFLCLFLALVHFDELLQREEIRQIKELKLIDCNGRNTAPRSLTPLSLLPCPCRVALSATTPRVHYSAPLLNYMSPHPFFQGEAGRGKRGQGWSALRGIRYYRSRKDIISQLPPYTLKFLYKSADLLEHTLLLGQVLWV